jgi:hypothetical protein
MLPILIAIFLAPPSPVIFPTQSLPLHFAHAQHLRLAGVGCGTCHESAAGSTRAADNLIPAEDACAACHEIDHAQPDKQASPAARCDACHVMTGPAQVAPTAIPAPNLKFNHTIHVGRGMRCAGCHAVADVGLATRAELPRMASCLGCHDGKTAPAACTTCHIAAGNGMVQTDFAAGRLAPSGVLRGDAHDLRFRMDHAQAARDDDRYCANCHTRAWCLDCHNGVVKPFDFHGNDYVHLHTVQARRNDPDCGSCHRLQTFCTGCHARLGVNTDPKTSEYQRPSTTPDATHRFHPPGHQHGVEAQRNLKQCASCHRESFCSSGACHGTMFSPHPVDWLGSSRCKALLARAGRMCLRCHTRADEARCE